MFMVNVGKYTIHGSRGISNKNLNKLLSKGKYVSFRPYPWAMKFQAPGCSGQKKGYDILMCGSWQSVYPYPHAPWDWNIYLVDYHQFKPNVGTYSSPMEHVGSYLPNLLATYDHNHVNNTKYSEVSEPLLVPQGGSYK